MHDPGDEHDHNHTRKRPDLTRLHQVRETYYTELFKAIRESDDAPTLVLNEFSLFVRKVTQLHEED